MTALLFSVAERVWGKSPSFVRKKLLWISQRTYTAGVLGLVPDERDAVLLLKHRFRLPFSWGLPGGYLEAGETPGEALSRELEEEVGIRAEPECGVLEHELNHATRCISYFVLTTPLRAPMPRLNPSELLECRFCRSDNLPEGLQPTHAEALRRYWQGRRSPTNNLVVVS